MKRQNSIMCVGVLACGFAGAASASDDALRAEVQAQAFRVIEEKVVVVIEKPPEVPWCPADWDHDGRVTLDELYPFLAEWFGGSCGGDVNMDGQLTVQDIFDFLGMLAMGSCPPAKPSDK